MFTSSEKNVTAVLFTFDLTQSPIFATHPFKMEKRLRRN